jgi:hypothetical protein
LESLVQLEAVRSAQVEGFEEGLLGFLQGELGESLVCRLIRRRLTNSFKGFYAIDSGRKMNQKINPIMPALL